ncbi:MAG: SMC-Scp complex subunit ScpB [Bacilli bacterium]|nr:SMC-Scp complex subunit ScpB [Bacilli bacterium]
MEKLGILEGILFVVGNEGISISELMDILELKEDNINYLIDKLKERYLSEESGLNIEYLGGKYKLTTKKEHNDYYIKLLEKEKKSELSNSALETLAVIAYNSPITRGQIDDIRGVDSTYQIKKLLYRNLIKEDGKADLPGKPKLYSVTNEFLDYLGLSSLDELPKLEEEKPVLIEETDLYESKYKENY